MADIRYLSNPQVIAEELNKLYNWSPKDLKKKFGEYNFSTQYDVNQYTVYAYNKIYRLTPAGKIVERKTAFAKEIFRLRGMGLSLEEYKEKVKIV